jgi:hypothetical protein
MEVDRVKKFCFDFEVKVHGIGWKLLWENREWVDVVEECTRERAGLYGREGGRGTRGIQPDITDFSDPVLDEFHEVFTKGKIGARTTPVYGCGNGVC